jgi:hypothetical protein
MMNVIQSWLGSNWQVFAMESSYPWDFEDSARIEFHLTDYTEDWPVFVLTRDYLNWFASWIKMTKGDVPESRDPRQTMLWADRWKVIHEEAIGTTSHIPNKVTICYDAFVEEREYRWEICNLIGGTYNEGILNFVPGTGSSFHGRFEMQGRGREMKVLERWKWLLTEEGKPYQEWLALRPDVLEYYMDNWGWDKEKKEFCDIILQKKVQTIN